MNNPFLCNNCINNPAQYYTMGGSTGYCIKHETLLTQSNTTTCQYHKRKDLPYFVGHEGTDEHKNKFSKAIGIVKYENSSQYKMERQTSNENPPTFNKFIFLSQSYRGLPQKWRVIEDLGQNNSPISQVMHSCLLRDYLLRRANAEIKRRLILNAVQKVGNFSTIDYNQFEANLSKEEFQFYSISFQQDIELLKMYTIQEYGYQIGDTRLTWISDELDLTFHSKPENLSKPLQKIRTLLIKYLQ